MKKLTLDPDAVAVESFPTDHAPPEDGRGTVHGRAACTYQASCLCQTAYYHCGDGYQTIYSCDYSKDRACVTSMYDC